MSFFSLITTCRHDHQLSVDVSQSATLDVPWYSRPRWWKAHQNDSHTNMWKTILGGIYEGTDNIQLVQQDEMMNRHKVAT